MDAPAAARRAPPPLTGGATAAAAAAATATGRRPGGGDGDGADDLDDIFDSLASSRVAATAAAAPRSVVSVSTEGELLEAAEGGLASRGSGPGRGRGVGGGGGGDGRDGGGGGGGGGGGWASWLDTIEASCAAADLPPTVSGVDFNLGGAALTVDGDDNGAAAAAAAAAPPVASVGPAPGTPADVASATGGGDGVGGDGRGPLRGFDALDEEQRFAVASLVCVLLSAEAERRRAAAAATAASKSSAAAAAAAASAAAASAASAASLSTASPSEKVPVVDGVGGAGDSDDCLGGGGNGHGGGGGHGGGRGGSDMGRGVGLGGGGSGDALDEGGDGVAPADGPFCAAFADKLVAAVGVPPGAQAALLALVERDADLVGGNAGGGGGSGDSGSSSKDRAAAARAAAARTAAAEAAAAAQCARLVGGGAARLAALQALLTVAVVGGDYDARARVLLQRVASVLGVEWPLVAAIELAVAVHLAALHSAAADAAAAIDAPREGGDGAALAVVRSSSLPHPRAAAPSTDALPAPASAAEAPTGKGTATSAELVVANGGDAAASTAEGVGDAVSALPPPRVSTVARRRRRRLRDVKVAKLSGITLAGGLLFGLTGGLIAPALLGSLAALGVASAATLAATGGVASGAVVGSLFGVAGMGITGNKARRRLRTWVGEFEFERPGDPRIARARARRADRERGHKGGAGGGAGGGGAGGGGGGTGVTDADVAVAEAAAVEAEAEIRAAAAKKKRGGGGRSWSRMLRGKSKRPSQGASLKQSGAATKPPLPSSSLPATCGAGDGAAASTDGLPSAAEGPSAASSGPSSPEDLITHVDDTEDFFGAVDADEHTLVSSSGSSTSSSRTGRPSVGVAATGNPPPRASSVPGAARAPSSLPLEPSTSAPISGRTAPVPPPSTCDGSEASATSATSAAPDIMDEEAYPDFPGGRAGLDALDPSLHVTICVPAWLHESTFGSSLAQFEVALQTLLPYSQHAALRWESGRLVQMGHAFARFWASKATVTTIQQAYPHVVAAASSVGGMLAASIALPLTVISCLDYVDNPWSVCISRANGAGEELADVLAARTYGRRPVTLIGYSLGARVVFKALKSLAARGAYGIVDNAFLLGAPVSASPASWRAAQTVVSGRLVNGYCSSDWALAYFHRGVGHGVYVAGLRPVTTPGVENVDMSKFGVAGHRGLSEALPRALHALGVSTGRITMPPAPLPGSSSADGGVESTALVVATAHSVGGDGGGLSSSKADEATTVAAADGEFWLAGNGASAGSVAASSADGRGPPGLKGTHKRGKHGVGGGKWFGSAWPSWSSPKRGRSRPATVGANGADDRGKDGTGDPAAFDGVRGSGQDLMASLPPPVSASGAFDAVVPGAHTADAAGGSALAAANGGEAPAAAGGPDPSSDLDAQFQAYLRRHNVRLPSEDADGLGGALPGSGGDASSGDDTPLRTVVLPLSIELTERRARPFLAPGMAYPISVGHVLTNAADEQRGLVVRLWEGAVSSTVPLALGRRGSRTYPRLLASVELGWARPRPRGTMRFSVTLSMEEDGDVVLRVSRQMTTPTTEGGAPATPAPRRDPLVDAQLPPPVAAAPVPDADEIDSDAGEDVLTAEARIPAARLCSHTEARSMEEAEREGKRRSKAKASAAGAAVDGADKKDGGGGGGDGGPPPLLALPAPPSPPPPTTASAGAAAPAGAGAAASTAGGGAAAPADGADVVLFSAPSAGINVEEGWWQDGDAARQQQEP